MLSLNAQGHQYGLDSSGLRYRDPAGRETAFPFGPGLRLRASSLTGALSVRYRRASAPLSPLPPEQLREFLGEFFRQWRGQDPESAQKAAFDYVDAQRGFVGVAFAACLLVSLPVAVALLADSHQQFRCTRELREHAVPGVMQVTKARKRDSRTFLLNLAFTAPNGQVIKGQEEVLTETDANPPMSFPIVYSPDQPECWSLTKSEANTEVNWARRRYFAAFGFLFGLFFLGTTVLGLGWCLGRWTHPRPFREEVRARAELP